MAERKNQLSQKTGRRLTRGLITVPSEVGIWKLCEECATSGDKFWKTILQKHGQHPGQFPLEHKQFVKHLEALRNKKEINKILSIGTVIRQMVKGLEARKNAQRM